MKILNSDDRRFEREFNRIRRRGTQVDRSIVETVEHILQDVAVRGDEALFEYTEKYDGHALDAATVEVSAAEAGRALEDLPDEHRHILETAAARIERFHRRQRADSWFDRDEEGITVGQVIRPLDRVGIYAPGGLAPYPSTVLMAAIPAKVAGVGEIILATPARGGVIHPLILAAAVIGGVDRIFRIGGAQAVGAMAYGTESIPLVDKIVGPGNIYVALAKKMVYGRVGIDMIAGPSEILIISDGTVPPGVAAADLLSQAEHDEMACSILLTPSGDFARQVKNAVEEQLERLPKKAIASAALESYGALIVTRDLDEAVEIANRYAPEHIELMVEHPESWLPRIRNAGAVFLGGFSPEAMGDYIAGPNHILPTGGTARFFSPLGVYDFIKRMSVISFSEGSFRKYGDAVSRFAAIEGLDAHERSIAIRLNDKG
ncbi:MAG: histidinol dehydrogenase [Deltaproteobacteria bacterium]|nr:histidinol dehydrogenase [Deltaproteobacteria bacterium]